MVLAMSAQQRAFGRAMPVGLRRAAQVPVTRTQKRDVGTAANPAAMLFNFAKAQAPPVPEVVAPLSNPALNGAINVLIWVAGAFVAITLLNGVRAVLRNAWQATAEKNPGGLLAGALGVVLNILGVDMGTVKPQSMPDAPSPPSPRQAASAAKSAVASSSSTDATGLVAHLKDRTEKVQKHFPGSLAVDDFLARVEVALASFGFRGDNSLALTNVCRDESTGILKSKIDEIYGQAFNINGLGGVVTCGVTGIGAGISHAPIDAKGRERYVFFAFPHAAVDGDGVVSDIYRPGIDKASKACGAILFAVGHMQENGIEEAPDATHDPKEPEGTILLSRLKEQMRMEKADPTATGAVEMTKIAGRVITRDLEGLIAKAVSTDKADYAVVTGCQVHSWPQAAGQPAIEYVMPTTAYVVINGVRSELDLSKVPPLTPRQVAILAAGGGKSKEAAVYLEGSTAQGVEQPDPAMVAPSALVTGARKGAAGQDEHKVPAWASQFCC